MTDTHDDPSLDRLAAGYWQVAYEDCRAKLAETEAENRRLRGEVGRLTAERDAWSDEASRMLRERNAVIALCVKHYHTEGRPVWWDLVGITGCSSPAEAVRVAAGLPKSADRQADPGVSAARGGDQS